MDWNNLAYEQAKCTTCNVQFKQYLICVYSFVNNTWFDLRSVILFCCFYGEILGKPIGKIHFHYLRVRSASLTDVRVRIRNKTNGGLNISKREICRAVFPNCAPVSFGEQRIRVKQVFIYWFI